MRTRHAILSAALLATAACSKSSPSDTTGTKAPTAVVYLATKLLYGPLNRSSSGSRLARHLFYNDYLSAISHFGWREQHTIVFDHLVAPTSHYIRREDFEEWWRDIDAREVVIGWHNKNSWRGFGKI